MFISFWCLGFLWFSAFWLMIPQKTPILGTTDLIKSHKHTWPNWSSHRSCMYLPDFHVFHAEWESSRGVLGLGAACLTSYSAVVFRSTYSLNELFIWFGIWGSYSLVYANSLQSLHVYIFSGCLYFLLAAFFLWQINQPRVTHVPGTAAHLTFTRDHVRNQSATLNG